MGGTESRGTAIVAGAGIGGLATAVALMGRGWQVRVLERAAEFGEVGAGLSVWPNGIRALDALGLGERVRDLGIADIQAGIRDPSGRWLSRIDAAEFARRHGPPVMIHRARLAEVLLAAVPRSSLVPGAAVRHVRPRGSQLEIEYDGGVERADLLVGADGIRSTVRRAVWPHAPGPRYAGYTAWRTVVDLGTPLREGGETWGRGQRIGFAPLCDGRVYVFAVAGVPEGGRSGGGELAELRRRFGGWHDPVPRLLEAAADEAVLRHDIYELPPLPSFVEGRVALVGDAAHAMTPNLGQGANQALEDAVTLAALLDTVPGVPGVPAALVAYHRIRRPRTRRIAARSRQLGRVAQWRSAPAVALRDRALRLAPQWSLFRSLAPVVSWRPPDTSGPPHRLEDGTRAVER
ncbi:monooxygenase [Amycolatopsis rhizosphaerae]|uniref:Monooxygenase n=1 Tax=Amycolatopsis rhizosphaerae TaxID=2053003 RepID=A0A558CUN5_9PSEU|nr:FAD-dependent monooxygenase [Amycolatopsis rhizosphaerae]TVT52481.1 monooxygenase [Amycolatopsis rhizosphaerae]